MAPYGSREWALEESRLDTVPLGTYYPNRSYWNESRPSDVSSTTTLNISKKDDEPIVKVESKTSAFSPTAISNTLTGLSSRGGPSREWKTTIVRFGPLSGVFMMLVAIASIVAALGILAGSDNTPVKDWLTPPATYLAIFTAISNLSVRYAAVQGVIIAWWYGASRSEGATLEKLHYNWLSGSSLHRALMAGRHMGLLGLACIFSTIVVIDGPLLQRASTVDTAHWDGQNIPLNISMAQELPRFFVDAHVEPRAAAGSQFHWSYAFNNTFPTGDGGTASNNIYPVVPNTDLVLQLASLIRDDTALAGVIQGCPGTCVAKLRAPAFAERVCTSTKVPIDYTHIQPIRNNQLGNTEALPLEWEQFFMSVGIVLDDKESLNLVTAYPEYTDVDNCSGHLNMTACTFDSAIGEYTISITDGKVTLLDAEHPRIISLSNTTAVDTHTNKNGGKRSTLAPIVQVAFEKFESLSAFYSVSNATMSEISNGPASPIVREFQKPSIGICPVYSDPRPYVMKDINKIMVWAGSAIASQNGSYKSYLESQTDPNLPMHTQVNGQRTGSHSVFHTDYAWFIAAALVETLCLAFIAPTYWGWWKLGRDMSFSPLEIAKAFRAPMLDEYHSNSRGRHIAKAGSGTRLRYGVIELDSSGDTKAVAFADPASVSDPQDGTYLAR